jgi:hypothetical protein
MVDDLHYDIASDPRTNRPALLAKIAIRALANGRHELRIGRAQPAIDSRNEDQSRAEAKRDDVVIPFWK